MTFGMRFLAIVVAVVALRPSAMAFVVQMRATSSSSSLKGQAERPLTSFAPERIFAASEGLNASSEQRPRPASSFDQALRWAAMGAATGFATASGALAKYIDPDDVGEVVSGELPPMWVPLAFAGAITVGIFFLQVSLGDVMNDEAKLGAMSGARAAKQSARDRDMFKKKDPPQQ